MQWNRATGSQWFTTDDLPNYKIRDVYEPGFNNVGCELWHRDRLVMTTHTFGEAQYFARLHQLVSANITQIAPRVAGGDGWDDIAEDYDVPPVALQTVWISIMDGER